MPSAMLELSPSTSMTSTSATIARHTYAVTDVLLADVEHLLHHRSENAHLVELNALATQDEDDATRRP